LLAKAEITGNNPC